MSTKQMSFTITDKPQIINGIKHTVTAVNGLDRVEINNKLHDIGDQIMKLRMQQDALVQMRNLIDRQHEETEDLFAELFVS
jgi:hypothetical protein